MQHGESAAGIQLPKCVADALLVLLVLEVEIVDRQRVDAVQPEPLEAVLVGSRNAPGAVVEAKVEGVPAAPSRRPRRANR